MSNIGIIDFLAAREFGEFGEFGD